MPTHERLGTDDREHLQGAEPLYTVGFPIKDLWDDVRSPRDMVFVDMWESYLEPT
jgi:Nitrile hydratase beta subunit, C-terminal